MVRYMVSIINFLSISVYTDLICASTCFILGYVYELGDLTVRATLL